MQFSQYNLRYISICQLLASFPPIIHSSIEDIIREFSDYLSR